MDKKTLQEKYVELQILSMQIKQVEEQLAAIDQKALELSQLRGALHGLHNTKPGTKSFIPIGPGIFTTGTIENTSEVLLNVGAGIIVRKTTHEAEHAVGQQIGQLDDLTLELSHNLKELVVKAQQIESDVDSHAEPE